MTVKELLEVLKKFDDNLEVVNAIPATAFDCDTYGEDIDIEGINEDSFEFDANHNVLVFKAAGDMPSNRDWEQSYWWKHHR